MSLILDSIFASVALSHFFVDLLNGTRAILLTYLSVPLGLSNATLGLISTIYVLIGSLSQPLFGYLTDKIGTRWVVSLGVFWMGLFYILSLVTPGPASLVLLITATIGSGAFHPAGAMQATVTGRTHYSGRETTAASFFFLYGQLGYFFGPILAGPLLDKFGPIGLAILVIPILPTSLFAMRHLRVLAIPKKRAAVPGQKRFEVRGGAAAILPFAFLALCQSWTQANMTTFVPKYLSDLGQTASTYGIITALFMGGSAIGNLLGGTLADRLGRRIVTTSALILAVAPLYLVPAVDTGWLYFLVPLAGFFTGANQSIIVVHGQHLIPGGMALATGLVMGLTFSGGAVGTYISGLLADFTGLPSVFQMSAGLALAGALTAFMIFAAKRDPSRVIEPVMDEIIRTETHGN